MNPVFHLSIGVHSIGDSTKFFVDVLGGKILYKDPTGYVNLDVFGVQITLRESPGINPDSSELHFGFNLSHENFNRMAESIRKHHPSCVFAEPTLVDPNTPLERKKMVLKCPTGYLVELKGYQ